MPGRASKKSSSRKGPGELQVVDMESVEVLNRRGNRVYRPRPVIVKKEMDPKPVDTMPGQSGAKRRRTPSDPLVDPHQGPDPDSGGNQTKKKKVHTRQTMVRKNRQ
jgi:hypothetical protein